MTTIGDLLPAFLLELEHSNRSAHTQRAYRTDLKALADFYSGPISDLNTEILRQFFAQHLGLEPATRARKQAAVASFLKWAYQRELIPANPMGRVERVSLNPPTPRGVKRAEIERVLKLIPSDQFRDRLLFRLLLETGLRISEALGLYIEDLDLTLDNERLTVIGKGGRQRTVLLEDPHLVKLLRRYLKLTGYQHGPLFRATKNGRGGSLRYQSVQERWQHYCQQAGVICTLHQLRHTHATELINGGVSLNTIRKRLGHQHLQTTLRYAEQSDDSMDIEIRAWRRTQHPD